MKKGSPHEWCLYFIETDENGKGIFVYTPPYFSITKNNMYFSSCGNTMIIEIINPKGELDYIKCPLRIPADKVKIELIEKKRIKND